MEKQKVSPKVTTYISTKGRYFSTLPLAILSVANQTYKPVKLIIFDDTDVDKRVDLRTNSLYQNIFGMLMNKGINWEVVYGEGRGQVVNHQNAIDKAETEFIHRLDDDEYLEPNTIENLVSAIDDKVGAVGGLVLHPNQEIQALGKLPSNKIEDIFLGLNIQWYKWNGGIREVDHLYSTFIYRKEAAKQIGGYCQELSPVGHREETLFTHELKRAGWKLLVEPKAITWHLRDSSGGIRSFDNRNLWQQDENVFMRKLMNWGVKPTDYKFFVLDSGIGDHIIFKKLLPEIKKKYPNQKFIVSCCYNGVFEDMPELELISIAEAQNYLGNIDSHNVYKYMLDRSNKIMTLEEAYREMYQI